MIKLLLNFVNGLAFGVTQIVPGVSGGTVAIIMGFYDELIYTINNFTKDYKRSFSFVLPFVIGIGLGIILFSSLISFLLERFSLPTMLFFVGLIVGIAPAIFNKIKEPGERLTLLQIILIIIPIILLVVISHLTGADSENERDVTWGFMTFLFLAGALAAAGLIIPGVSGSFILILMGVYYIAVDSLGSVRELFSDPTNTELIVDIMKIMLPIGLGVILGGLLTARLIGKLLEKYSKIIYSIIFGLIIGSVYALMREPMVFQSGTTVPLIITAIIACAVGCFVSFSLGKKRM